jgi:hypothetical protein
MLESGQYYGQQGYYPEWQSAGVARGNSQAPALTRAEAIRLYEVNLAAYHEAVRRRDRHMWFFAAANFGLIAGLVLTISLTGVPALAKIGSFLAVFVGIPICSAWRRALDQSRTERELALAMVRKLETDAALRYSPLGEDAKPDTKAENAAIGRERFLPRVLFWLYLGLAAYVWQAEILALGDRFLGNFSGYYEYLMGGK